MVPEKIFKSCLIWAWSSFLSCDLDYSHLNIVSSNGCSTRNMSSIGCVVTEKNRLKYDDGSLI